MARKKLESSLVNLFRKAKNDLEEGGANTLYLALGMLAWRESPEDNKVYKAPLILIPVQLLRRSARAPIRVQQIAGEEPLFNATLVEFLLTEHGVNISHLLGDLPEDESGLDVARIWMDVRAAISEQPGFEVVEECVIASFSFAKYLMWKDLKDRLEHLKENVFVEHMIDRPHEAYHQDASFLSTEDLDRKIDPSEIFLPLNCDSSQLVAVEASSRQQDFVLEGPPGTGKSETIANMIANNLAKGRKVLFVAEKIAALQVVYRRLEKIGLDHLALELHSNKANKKAVLDQLRRASDSREEYYQSDWFKDASQLKQMRSELNEVVAALHETSSFGISVRRAISIAAGAKYAEGINFDWGLGVEASPVNDSDGISELRDVAKHAGIAFADVKDIDHGVFSLISATTWSFAWESSVLGIANEWIDVGQKMQITASAFANEFGVEISEVTPAKVRMLASLSRLLGYAVLRDIRFALGARVSDRLSRLEELSDLKERLDEQVLDIGHGVSAPKLLDSPIDRWVTVYEDTKNSWFKSKISSFKINKEARDLGYDKFGELSIVLALQEAREVANNSLRLINEFEELEIWDGWSTSPEALRSALTDGREVHSLVGDTRSLSSDSMLFLAMLRRRLVDEIDFFEGSTLERCKQELDLALLTFSDLNSRSDANETSPDDDKPLTEIVAGFRRLIDNKTKIKPWVEWNSAKKACSDRRIPGVAQALQDGRLDPGQSEQGFFEAFCLWLVPRLIDAKEVLRGFKASEHEQKILDFRSLDREIAARTSQFVASELSKKKPDITSAEHSKDFRVLSRELQKKTRHKPVRVLFDEMGERLLDLCPCLMMSPLSVAQFLPSDFNAFDVVIFDEASQMTTWDSVGAIARGKNVVVVGDPKQMPPTNFFNSSIDPDDPDEGDLESILDQALAAGLPHIRLTGHYRSKHETLIAFSNSKYYENALVTFPSADTKETAVSLRRVNGLYSKEKTQTTLSKLKLLSKKLSAGCCTHGCKNCLWESSP